MPSWLSASFDLIGALAFALLMVLVKGGITFRGKALTLKQTRLLYAAMSVFFLLMALTDISLNSEFHQHTTGPLLLAQRH